MPRKCAICGEEIETNQGAVRAEHGYLDEEDQFYPSEHGKEILCWTCYNGRTKQIPIKKEHAEELDGFLRTNDAKGFRDYLRTIAKEYGFDPEIAKLEVLHDPNGLALSYICLGGL